MLNPTPTPPIKMTNYSNWVLNLGRQLCLCQAEAGGASWVGARKEGQQGHHHLHRHHRHHHQHHTFQYSTVFVNFNFSLWLLSMWLVCCWRADYSFFMVIRWKFCSKQSTTSWECRKPLQITMAPPRLAKYFLFLTLADLALLLPDTTQLLPSWRRPPICVLTRTFPF